MFAHLLQVAAMTGPPVDPAPVKRLARMAREMARPVCRGYLPYSQADAALICGTLQAERAGALQIGAGEMIGRLRLTLKGWIEREHTRRAVATHHIQRAVKPMIAAHRPWDDLIAQAHDSNNADSSVLTEDEVTDVVREEVYWALPTAPYRRSPRHG